MSDVSSNSSKTTTRSCSPNSLSSLSSVDSLESINEHFCESGVVIDIGGGTMTDTLLEEMNIKLLWKFGQFQQHRLLPAAVMHDSAGLSMWPNIVRLPHYYQMKDEVELLKQNSSDLVRCLAKVNCLIDLGCGDVAKIMPLLEEFERQKRRITYYALDLASEILQNSLLMLNRRFRYVQCFGLWGTFNDGLTWVQRIRGTKCYMSLGSMFGNDHFPAAVARLQSWRDIMTPNDRMLLGLDATRDKDEIWKSYHNNLFHDFVINGFLASNKVVGHDWFKQEEWHLSGEILENPTMHRFVMVALQDVSCEEWNGLCFQKGTKIVCYEGFKYGPDSMANQFQASSLLELDQWQSPSGRIYQYLLKRADCS